VSARACASRQLPQAFVPVAAGLGGRRRRELLDLAEHRLVRLPGLRRRVEVRRQPLDLTVKGVGRSAHPGPGMHAPQRLTGILE
jgi:hypothetical protein